jgi:NADH-quinone oxidoreductase subunit E
MNLKPETLNEIEGVIPQYPRKRSAMLPVLHAVQRDQGYISNEAMEWIAGKLEVAPINVYEVVTFYPYFRRHPIGRHHIRVCRTLSCALCGSYKIADVLKEEFGCELGETSPDGSATIEFAECLASCHTGPVMLVDEELVEKVDEDKARAIARKIKEGGK